MSTINLQPLFKYLDERFAEVDSRFDRIEYRLNNLETAVSNMSGEYKTLGDELTISHHRTSQLEQWARPVGKKVDIPFKP